MEQDRVEETPLSPTAIALRTGLGIPGLVRPEAEAAAGWLEDVRGPLEEVLATAAVAGTGAALPEPGHHNP